MSLSENLGAICLSMLLIFIWFSLRIEGKYLSERLGWAGRWLHAANL